MGLLYSVVGLLAANLALCVWVAYSFKVQKFDYVWPIKVGERLGAGMEGQWRACGGVRL